MVKNTRKNQPENGNTGADYPRYIPESLIIPSVEDQGQSSQPRKVSESLTANNEKNSHSRNPNSGKDCSTTRLEPGEYPHRNNDLTNYSVVQIKKEVMDPDTNRSSKENSPTLVQETCPDEGNAGIQETTRPHREKQSPKY